MTEDRLHSADSSSRLHSVYSGAAGRGVVKRKFNWRRLSLVLLLAALALDLVALSSYYSDKRFFVSIAAEIMNGQSLTGLERLERFVEYAHNLPRPTYDELKPPLVRFYYKYNPFHPSAQDVVLHGCDYRGGCGSSSRVVMALLDASGIESRSLILRDSAGRRVHAVVNAKIAGRWAVADPLYGLVFTRPSGEIVTAEELRKDQALFLANTERNPSYPSAVFTYDNYALMNWEKIPVILPAIRWALSRTIGEERTASISRPKIWMYPLPAFAILFTMFVFIFAGIVRIASKRSTIPEYKGESPR